MASYKYPVDCGYYFYYAQVEIRPKYRRFHSMAAQHSFEVLSDDDGIARFKVWTFISYNTPICRVTYDIKYDVWYYTVNDDAFRCSHTTIKQFSRWLNEHTNFISYLRIKELSMQPKSGTPAISTVSHAHNVHVSFCTDKYMRDYVGW